MLIRPNIMISVGNVCNGAAGVSGQTGPLATRGPRQQSGYQTTMRIEQQRYFAIIFPLQTIRHSIYQLCNILFSLTIVLFKIRGHFFLLFLEQSYSFFSISLNSTFVFFLLLFI